jgi:3',5'-cyclic AMP phosphodiesterase CpdA
MADLDGLFPDHSASGLREICARVIGKVRRIILRYYFKFCRVSLIMAIISTFSESCRFDITQAISRPRRDIGMPEFRLIQISDTHLARRSPTLTANFHRVSEHIDAKRPDLVINTGDLAFDGPSNPDDLEFAKTLHDALPVACRHLPGNHDIGDNPTEVGPPPAEPVSEQHLQKFLELFGEDRWHFDAAGWCFIGLNSQLLNTSLPSEAEQFDWLAAQLARAQSRPVAVFLHKPLFLNSPDDPELFTSSIRYVPIAARKRLIEMLRSVDLRLVACGHIHQRRDYTPGRIRHIWSPSAAFTVPDSKQEIIALKEVGLVEYRFQPDSFEVFHVRAPGQIDVDVSALIGAGSKGY